MSSISLVILSFVYLLLLFGFAFYFRKYDKLSNNKYAYALSICVYCTAWTFYGSIGRSAETGFGYLGVYLGPTLIAPFLFLILTKTVKISKYLRISSLADFISARFGKDTLIGALVTILCILIAIPYISIQLKALNLSFDLLTQNSTGFSFFDSKNIFLDPALYFGVMCAIISSIFGTIKAAPTDRHPGVITVVAFESVFKLIAFLIGAAVIIYMLNNGVSSIFTSYSSSGLSTELLDLKKLTLDGNQWLWICVISAFAFLLLPRQFHMAVVENKEVEHVRFASWFVPLYLFIISILVLPIAYSGLVQFGTTASPDSYFIDLLMSEDFSKIALIVFIGGLAASTGMIISSLISLSIMMSNHIVLPGLLKIRSSNVVSENQLIQFRRLLIFVILLLSYIFYKFYAVNYSLVSIGLISFVGISQLAPSYLLGLYWKFANSTGVIAGLITGIALWAYMLPIVNLCEIGIMDSTLLENGPFGFEFLRPQAIFGLEGMDPISLSSMVSLSANFVVTCIVSLGTNTSPIEISQSDIFLHPEKYINNKKVSVISRQADFKELKAVLKEILGARKVKRLLDKYLRSNKLEKFEDKADTALIEYLENYLSGSLGSAGTKLVLNNIVKNQPVQPEQLFKVLDQTNQLYEYSKELEEKRDELNVKSTQLAEANSKLKELDQLKNEFISNITHELRTPLTSIQSLADSLNRFDLSIEEKTKVVSIIKMESERISKLVNQVLDLRKLESTNEVNLEMINLAELISEVISSLDKNIGNREIIVKGKPIQLFSDPHRLKQIILNILANSIKFTDSEAGVILIKSENLPNLIKIEVVDNGKKELD